MSSLLTELQFCQLENEVLKSNLKKHKDSLERIKSDIWVIFRNIEQTISFHTDDGSIRLSKQDRERIMQLIEKELKSK